jgi:hypothetical protein
LLGIATLLLPTYGGRQNLGGKVVVAAVLGGLSVVRAHNWMSSPSRSNFEATQQSGCLPKTSDDPHLVLGLDQKFPLAFTMGHGANPRERSRSSWIAFVRAADEEKLTTMRYKEDGEQYLNNIPDNALRYEGPEWVNFYFEGTQFRRNGGLLGEFENTGTGSNTKVQAGEPGYFDWADNMAGKDFYEQCEDPGDYCKQDDGSDCIQWRYGDGHYDSNVRVQYVNPQYPHIISYHRFTLPPNGEHPRAREIAWFQLLGLPEGDYIAHYQFRGFQDCVDIRVQTNPVARPWVDKGEGIPPPPTPVPTPHPVYPNDPPFTTEIDATLIYIRKQNCEFIDVLNPITPCRKMHENSAQVCLRECNDNPECTAVQAVRVTPPDWTVPSFPSQKRIPNLPTTKFTGQIDAEGNVIVSDDPCTKSRIRQRDGCNTQNDLCDLTKLDVSEGDYVCYGLAPFDDPKIEVGGISDSSDDPNNPVMYGTCWEKSDKPQKSFVPPLPQFDFADRCLDCTWRENFYTTYPFYKAPDWTTGFATTCKDCRNPDA